MTKSLEGTVPNLGPQPAPSCATGRDHLTEGTDLHGIGLSRLRNVAQRAGAWLALLALVVQIAASFGHMHAQDSAGDISSHSADIWHNSVGANATVSPLASLAGDEDQCPICFSASLLATSFVPLAEQAAAVVKFGVVSYASASVAFRLPESGRAPFRSRAPPSA
jgi:Protein of unknown function (DUF2946)